MVAFLLASAVCAADHLAELQAHFDKETHASSKVKALQKLADTQFEITRKAAASGDFSTVGFTFEKYRDNVRSCLLLLKSQDPDVDKHASSYRQLELQARKGIRELEDTLLVAPPAVRPPLELVHKDLLDMDNELIAFLFPRRSPDVKNVSPPPEAKP